MTDQEKWKKFLLKYIDINDISEIYNDSIFIAPTDRQNKVIGDHWASIEIYFDKTGKFKNIELSGG